MIKNIITILIIMLCFNANTLYTQGIAKRQSFTANLELFNGTWEYANGNELFRIVLKMGTNDTNLFYGSCLLGDYFYSKNAVVMDSYNEISLPTTYDENSRNSIIIFASNGNIRADWVRPYTLYVFFRDKRLNKFTGSGGIEFVSPTQIHWVLKGEEGVYDNDDSFKGFSVPTDVIMTKK